MILRRSPQKNKQTDAEEVQYRIPITNLVSVKIMAIKSKIEDGEE